MQSKTKLRKLGVGELINRKDIYETVDDIIKETPKYINAKVLENAVMDVGGQKFKITRDQIITMPIYMFADAERAKTTRRVILKPHKTTFKSQFRRYYGQDLNNKTLLISRTGGIGDLIFIQPMIKYLKAKYPTCKILFATAPKNMDLFYFYPEGLIDRVIPIPFDQKAMFMANYHLMFDGVIESCKEAERVNAYDLMNKTAGLNIDMTKQMWCPELTTNTSFVKGFEQKYFVRLPENTIILQMSTSSMLRTASMEFWRLLIEQLIKETDFNFVILDRPERSTYYDKFIAAYFKDSPGRITNASSSSETIAHACYVLSKCHGVVGLDSSFSHIGAAFGKPTLTLYGPFTGDTRVKYYKNSEWVQPDKNILKCDKYPCFLHDDRITQCKMVRALDNTPNCMNSINTDEVVKKFKTLMAGEK
jgi:ADP-heptose:LPS heptosyltransferase